MAERKNEKPERRRQVEASKTSAPPTIRREKKQDAYRAAVVRYRCEPPLQSSPQRERADPERQGRDLQGVRGGTFHPLTNQKG